MNRITKRFSDLRASGKKGFIPFVSAGDPDLATTSEIVLTLAGLGADVIELGVPFSDPIADGPIIQASSQRALLSGADLDGILSMVSDIRERSQVPVVLSAISTRF